MPRPSSRGTCWNSCALWLFRTRAPPLLVRLLGVRLGSNRENAGGVNDEEASSRRSPGGGISKFGRMLCRKRQSACTDRHQRLIGTMIGKERWRKLASLPTS